jgi:DNA-directed RNA polymerase specialized sigma24 family protein
MGRDRTGDRTRTSSTSLAFDDCELMAAIRRGDATAATALHDRLRPRAEGIVRRLLGSRDPDLGEVVQQCTVEIVGTMDHYRDDCSLDTWTRAVAARAVYKHIRCRKIERRIFGELDV